MTTAEVSAPSATANWRMVRLADLGPLVDGDWILNVDYAPSGVRLLQVGDVGVGHVNIKSTRYISEETAERLGCTFLRPNDILISRMPDPIGRAGLMPDIGTRAITAVDVSIWRPDLSIANPQYLIFALSRAKWFDMVSREASGATRVRISRRHLENLTIPLPPPVEQRRIVAALRERLDAVAQVRAAAVAQLDAARALPASLLRSVFESDEARRWARVRLGDVCHIQLGKMLSPSSKTGENPKPYLRNANVLWDAFDLSDVYTMDFSKREAAKFELRDGDLLVCEGGEPGRAAIWNSHISPCYYQKALHRLRPIGGVNPRFVMYRLWKGAAMGEFLESHAKTTIAHLPAVRLRALEIGVPTPDEQASVVTRLDSSIRHSRSVASQAVGELAHVTALPQSLLRRAFAGEL